MTLDFTQNDDRFFKQRGISRAEAAAQVERIRQGVPWIRLQAPATDGAGIRVLSERQIGELTSLFEQAQGEGRVMKFVPASGAASRMFHALRLFVQAVETPAKPDPSVEEFFSNLDRFAFAKDLWDHCKRQGLERQALVRVEGRKSLIRTLLNPDGMNYDNLPKGMVQFHQYPDHTRTAFEEHLVEAMQYTQDKQCLARLHFTLSREHRERVVKFFETRGGKFLLSFSEQKASTDTIAVDLENRPFRLEDGSPLFRPGGHGALLGNLAESGGDIVFIKNVDNVTHDRFKPTTVRYKKALGGLLVRIQSKIFSYLRELEAGSATPQRKEEIGRFIEEALGFRAGTGSSQESLHKILHRPLRVCGMVPNRGQPGGAPFWVLGDGGTSSLQIVESSQVDRGDPHQWEIFCRAAYFNPVDLVCGLTDHRGRAFDLTQFCDEQAVFISEKTHEGRPLKALELPGLWNGGMAYWNTIFVEVPAQTFAPVKTVSDLLRPEHQP